uniref:Uncharacterized protein n=1 Tax=Arundo donax TaxID=35708 RepID=A0A0A9AN54_ARUDO
MPVAPYDPSPFLSAPSSWLCH